MDGGGWIRSGRVIGWEYREDRDGSDRLTPIVAWITDMTFEGGEAIHAGLLYLAETEAEAVRLASRQPVRE